MVAREVGINLSDDTAYEAHRPMYWPSISANGEFICEEQDGSLLYPDVYLAIYNNWRGTSIWHISSRQSETIKRSMKEKANPLSIDGIKGAFFRTYPVREAIAKFLPTVYEPAAIGQIRLYPF